MLAGHPGARRMYENTVQKYYWTHMTNDVHHTVKGCRSCASARGTVLKHHKYLKLFSTSDPP